MEHEVDAARSQRWQLFVYFEQLARVVKLHREGIASLLCEHLHEAIGAIGQCFVGVGQVGDARQRGGGVAAGGQQALGAKQRGTGGGEGAVLQHLAARQCHGESPDCCCKRLLYESE